MRIAHYCGNFSKTSETFVYNYIKELEYQDEENYVVTHIRKNRESRPFPRISLVGKPGRWSPRRLFHRFRLLGTEHASPVSFWPQVRDRLKREIHDINPDVIHAHFGPQGVRIAPVAEKLGLPLVITFYGSDISVKPSDDFWAEKYEALWPRTDAVTVLSEHMKQKAQQAGCPSTKISIVHLSRNLENFSFEPPERSVERVLFVGRLVPKKAPLDALKAVHFASRKEESLHLDVVGGGPLQEEVEQYVGKHDLRNVTIHGRVPSNEVARYMLAADAFLLPSKTAPNGDQEGTPTVLIEAQASGLPCVTTRHAGIPEMIPSENHDLLSPPGDVDSIAQTLLQLSNSAVDDLGQRAEKGRQKVENDFNLSEEVRSLRSVYSKINS